MADEITGRRHEWKRKPNGEVDDYGFDGDQHHGPRCAVCGDFLSTCCAPSQWEAILAGTYEETEDHWCDGPWVRSWAMPKPPGPDVAQVRDNTGRIWANGGDGTSWATAVHTADGDYPEYAEWVDLLLAGPVTEVSAEYDAWLARGNDHA